MIRRAQLAFVLAVIAAAVIVGTQLPLGQILGQRAAIASQTAELAKLQAQDAALSAQVHALGQSSTIAMIAHEQYGLIHPGQQSYVVLPAPSSGGSTSGPLSSVVIPPGDLMPSDAATSGTVGVPAPATPGAGFVGQVLDRLEFWRWAF